MQMRGTEGRPACRGSRGEDRGQRPLSAMGAYPTLRSRTGVYLLLIGLLCVAGALADDACTLKPNNGTNWFGAPSKAKACFDLISLDSSTRTDTLAIMQSVFSLYSFSDLVRGSVPPYNLNVRLLSKFPPYPTLKLTGRVSLR